MNNKINKINKQGKKIKVKLTAKEYEFLNSYAIHHNKQRAMRESGLNLKSNGTEYSVKVINERADQILRNEEARKYIHDMHETIFQNNCHDIQRAIEESYDNYLTLKDLGKYHEMNIAFEIYLKLTRFIDKEKPISVNTQIVDNSGGGITINYIKPEDLENK
jgi:hypothetical protein